MVNKTCKSMDLVFVFLLLMVGLKVCSSNSVTLPRISVRHEWLVDNAGRIRIFRGINSVQKGEPWYDRQILNETKLQYYRKWGFNVIRLGTMWSGLEPEEGKFNQTYLDILSEIVNQAGKYGIHTILDMHQDVFSSTACYPKASCYDGIPKWVGEKLRPSYLRYPWPFKEISSENWFLGYLTYSVSSAFQQFYDNVGGSIDNFVRFWTKIASTFKNNTNVLGYELINEPWAGNVYVKPKLFLPGEAVARNLFHVYDRTFKEINKLDSETLLFYEPVTWGVYGSGNITGTGFLKLPGGEEFVNRSVLSYHHYCWLLEKKQPSDDYPMFLRFLCDNIAGSRVIPNVLKSARRTGGSMFLTEFGICEPDGNPQSINTVECNFIMSQADEYFQSWNYWDSHLFDDNGDPKPYAVEGFTRPYARAIAGNPIKMNFNTKSKVFQFEYLAADINDLTTEIFLPEVHYQEGMDFQISWNADWNYDPDAQVLSVEHKQGTPLLVSVVVKPQISK